jgi:hypothetical protein|tara:strand:- start:1623 stop:2336 length:714 start_codon:yes stop_codon:yes gene_type:complete
MATSGTHTFNLDVAEIIQEAYERVGFDVKSGYDLVTARRSLNLLLTKWVNEGVNLFTLDLTTLTLTKDTATVNLAANQYLDIIDATTRDTNSSPVTDTECERISLSEYLNYPNKTTSGKPVQFAVERNSQFDNSGTANHKIYLFPVPDQTYYQLHCWTIRYPQDITDTYTQNPDVPRRYLPALISGLAFELANKNADKVDATRRAELKGIYNEEWQFAKEEDRERASFYIQPKIRGY